MAVIIKMDSLGYIYPCGRQALSGVSCEIEEGESVGLVGANGAGKSTFLGILAGLYMPAGGVVEIGGLALNKSNLQAIRQTVGLVFQNPDNQLFMPTVLDDVAFGLFNKGMDKVQIVAEAREALAMVGAENLSSRAPYQLSGGEKRLAAVAAVLAMQPPVLAFDEPTSGLDPFSRRQLIDIMINRAETKIIATHDLDMVLDVCDKVIILSAGRLIAMGKTKSILADKALLAGARLELPLKMQACPVCGKQ